MPPPDESRFKSDAVVAICSHVSNGLMEIFSGKVSIPGRHLEGRMAEDLTDRTEVNPALNMPTCKSVADIVPAIVCDPITRTCFAE